MTWFINIVSHDFSTNQSSRSCPLLVPFIAWLLDGFLFIFYFPLIVLICFVFRIYNDKINFYNISLINLFLQIEI